MKSWYLSLPKSFYNQCWLLSEYRSSSGLLTTRLSNQSRRILLRNSYAVTQPLSLNQQWHEDQLQQLTMLGAVQLVCHLPHLWR